MFDEVNDEALDRWICTVYNRYIEWFGQPRDPNWPMTVVHARTDACARLLLGREYVICLRVDYESDEQRKAATAHEVYHRMVWRTPGICKIPWVDEMLAFLASDHVLRLNGLEDYADYRKSLLLSAKCDLPFDRLVRFRRPLKPAFWPGNKYPPGFGEVVAQIGVELESLVGWESMCRMVQCCKWQAWLDSIPHDIRGEVCRILQLP